MAALVFLGLLLTLTGYSSANWCVCKQGLSDQVLQKTLDYACGAGADCNPIHQNGPCFNPNTVIAHCSYATNSYFQRKNQGLGTCDFAGATKVLTTDPSPGGDCSYPAAPSAASTSKSPSNTTNNPISNTPYTGVPSVGGISTGMGPGAGIDTDISHGGFTLLSMSFFFSFFASLFFSCLVFVWG